MEHSHRKNPIPSRVTADETWMRVAVLMAERSKDPQTKVGAVLVSPDGKSIAVGWNGFPAGLEETPERWERPAKYEFVIHAEENAILNSKCDLTGWTLYTTLMPCQRCVMKIMQSGIARVCYLTTNSKSVDAGTSAELLLERGIEICYISLAER